MEWSAVVLFGGLVAAAVFSISANPLEPLGIVSIPFWLAAIVMFAVGVLSTLVLVDLKRAFSAGLGIALSAALFYILTVWSPAAEMSFYSTHLLNYAMVQAVPVVIITLILTSIGALVGTMINSSVREFDL